eukprot:11227482-Lingulodinium_polyedra.AAC.1
MDADGQSLQGPLRDNHDRVPCTVLDNPDVVHGGNRDTEFFPSTPKTGGAHGKHVNGPRTVPCGCHSVLPEANAQ